MSPDGRCQEMRELVPELALGIADGEERALVLEHVSTCSTCRRELERLSAIGDELLELAPEHEPPLGFELRVLGSLEPQRRRTSSLLRRPLVLAAAVMAASAITGGALLLGFRDDRKLADHYRAALAEAHGSSFGAVRLRDAEGREGGVVFVYRGSPSWLMITLDAPFRRTVARGEVVSAAGRKVPLGWFQLHEGTWGGPVRLDLDAIASVRLLARDGHLLLTARLPPGR